LDDQLKAPIIPLFDCNHFCRKRGHFGDTSYCLPGESKGLLFRSQNCVLCRLGHSEFNDRFRRDFDLLLSLWIDANSRFPLLLHELAEAGQNELAFLANRFIRKVRERIQKKHCRSFVRLGRFGQRDLKFRFWSCVARLMVAE
jgi:hypothetical protein